MLMVQTGKGQTTIVGFGLISNNSATGYITGNSGCILSTNAQSVDYGGRGKCNRVDNTSKYWTTTSFLTTGYVGLSSFSTDEIG